MTEDEMDGITDLMDTSLSKLQVLAGLERYSGEGNGNPLVWEIPWTGEPGRLQCWGNKII